MTEYLDRACPHCGKTLRVRSQYLLKKVVCKYCNASFKVEGDPAPSGEDLRPRLAALEVELGRARADLEGAQQQLLQVTAAQERSARELARDKELLAEALEGSQRARGEIDALRQELDAARAEIATRVAAEDESGRRIAEALAALRRAEQEVDQYRQDRDVARQEVMELRARLEHEAEEARRRHARVEEELAGACGEVEQVRAELLASHQSYQERERLATEQRAAYEAEVEVKIRHYREEGARVAVALAELQADRDRLSAQLSEALARLEVATRSENERERLVAEREAARAKVTEVTARWQSEAEVADQARAQVEALVHDLAESRRAHDETAARLSDELRALRDEHTVTLTRLTRAAQERTDELRLAEAQRDLARAELRQEAEHFRVALETARAASDQEAARQVALVRASFDEERTRWFAEAEAQKQMYEGAVREVQLRQEEERRVWQAELARHLQDLEDVRREHQGALTEGQRLAVTAERLRSQLEQATAREAELLEAEKGARAELAQAREEIAQALEEVAQSRAKYAAAGAMHEQHAQADRYGFEQMLALAQWEADQHRRTLEADLADSRRELAMLRNVLQGMGVRV